MRLRPAGSSEPGFLIRRGDAVTVGRDSLNPLQIGHTSVAPFHCRLSFRDSGLFVEPVGRESILVGGESVAAECQIEVGDLVRLGEVVLEVCRGEKRTPRPQSLVDFLLGDVLPPVVSVAFHVALYLLLRHYMWMEPTDNLELALQSDRTVADVELWEDEESFDNTVLDEPEEPPDPEPEVEVEDAAEQPVVELEPVTENTLRNFAPGLGAGGSGTGGLTGGAKIRLGGSGSDSSGTGLVGKLRSMRGTGLDVVFLVDTTSSMAGFLDDAKRRIDGLVTKLAALVPDLRIGMVAFRDAGDEYVTRPLPLTTDRYEILNFLEDLVPAGGGDIPEAVEQAVSVARNMKWRKNTHRVMVLVGDAPPHSKDWASLRAKIKKFRSSQRDPRPRVSSVHTGGSTSSARRAAEAMAEIARLGKGDYLELDSGNVEFRMVAMVVGRKHEDDLRDILSRLETGPRERLIARKLEARDVDWLLGKLRRPPVHPDLVQALIVLGDRKVLRELRQHLVDPEVPLSVRRACLYVLRKRLGNRFRVDPELSARAQRRQLEALDALISRF